MKIHKRYPMVDNKFLRCYLYMADIFLFLLKLFPKRRVKKRNIKSILLRNPAALGDMFYTLQLIPIIKNRYPDVKIGVLCSSKSEKLVTLCSDVDYVHVDNHWLSSKNFFFEFCKWIVYRKKLISEINDIGYDVAIDLYYYYPSASFTFYLSNIPNIYGYNKIGGSTLYTKKLFWKNENKHNFEYQCDLLSLIGIHDIDVELRYKTTFRGIDINNIIKQRNVGILIAPCASTSQRELSIDCWIYIIKKLLVKEKQIFLLGFGVREEGICNDIKRHIKSDKLTSLCSKLKLFETLLMIKDCELFLGVESFLGHVAAFYQKKQISFMHGACNRYQWEPYRNPNCYVLRSKIQCSPCYYPSRCNNPHACVIYALQDINDALDFIGIE